MFFILISVIVGLVFYLVYRIRSLESYWKKVGIPYESYASFLYSNFVRYKREDVYLILEENNVKYGPVHGTYQGLTPLLRVNSVEGARDILVKNFSSAHSRSFQVETKSKIWNNGLLVLDYARWKMVRHVTGLGFTSAKLKVLTPTIRHVAKRLGEKLFKISTSTNCKIDPQMYAMGYAIDEIASVAYGLEIDAIDDPKNPFVVNGYGIFSPSLGLTLLFSAPWLLKYLPVEFPKKSISDYFTAFSATVIKERRLKGPNPDRKDILDLWLEEQKINPDFTDDLIAAQTFTFFSAGFESSAYTLFFTIYLLALNPEAQEAAYAEIIAKVSDPENITYEEYNSLKFVEACLFETLRLYPADFAVDRVVLKKCTVAGIPLEPGTVVQVPLPAMQRDPKYFSDPHCYFPERFLSGDATAAFLAFGDGPKNCIGKRLAILQLVIGLCSTLLKVRFVPCPDDKNITKKKLPIKLTEGMPILPQPKEQIFVEVKPRL